MIGKIAGRLDYRGSDHVLIDVRGVAYIVFVSDRTLAALPGPGGMAALYTDLVVREDLLQLYGFPTLFEKEWHRLLTSVQGVGAKASLAILGVLGAEGLGRAIALGDWTAVKAAPGVGPKLAQRVVNELKGKAPAMMALGGAAPTVADPVLEDAAPAVTPAPGAAAAANSAAATSEALSALANLGYGPGEAAGAIAEAAGRAPDAGTSDLIRAALRLLAPKG
jgi:Holliday junction DNA helicase RuvA